MFSFIFRFYGIVRALETLRHSLHVDFDILCNTHQTLSKLMPTLPDAPGSEPPSARRTRSAPSSNKKFYAFDNSSLALIKVKGYKLSEELRLWPKNIVKATKGGLTFALKRPDLKTQERNILRSLQWPNSIDNHVVKLVDIIFDGTNDIIVMPWLSSLASLKDCSEDSNAMTALVMQFLEGVSFIHDHNFAHLDLKPGNILVDDNRPVPQLSIIDFDMSFEVNDEETTVTGFRGTPSWTAPEVGSPNGLATTYSAIRADRWSCGRLLQYFSTIFLTIFPVNGAKFGRVRAQLLDMVPSKRPSLNTVVMMLRPKRSCGGGNNDLSYVAKRARTALNADSYVRFLSVIYQPQFYIQDGHKRTDGTTRQGGTCF